MATRFRPLTLSAAHYFYLAATLLLLGSTVGMVFEPEIRSLALGCDGRQDDAAPSSAGTMPHEESAVHFPR